MPTGSEKEKGKELVVLEEVAARGLEIFIRSRDDR